MNKLENQLEKLVNEFGIESVMNTLYSKNKDKVFIPNWYYQQHIKPVFGKSIKLTKLNNDWVDNGGFDIMSESISEMYSNIK